MLKKPRIFCKKLLSNTVYFAFRQLYTHATSGKSTAQPRTVVDENEDQPVFRDCNSNIGSNVYVCNSPAPVTPDIPLEAPFDDTDYQSIPSQSSVYNDPFDIVTRYGTLSERSQLSTNMSRRLASGMSFVSAVSEDLSRCSSNSTDSFFYEPVEAQSEKCQSWLDGISRTSSYRDIETECGQFDDDVTEYHDDPGDNTKDCTCTCQICWRCKSLGRATHCASCGLSTSPEDAKQFYYIASDNRGTPQIALSPCNVPVNDNLPFATRVEAVADNFASATLTVGPVSTDRARSGSACSCTEEIIQTPCDCTTCPAIPFSAHMVSPSPECQSSFVIVTEPESQDCPMTRCRHCQRELGDYTIRLNESRPFESVDRSTSFSPGGPCHETVSTNSGFFLTGPSSQPIQLQVDANSVIGDSPIILRVVPQLKDEYVQCDDEIFHDPRVEPEGFPVDDPPMHDPVDDESVEAPADENESTTSTADSDEEPPDVPPLLITADCSAQTTAMQQEVETVNRGCSPITESSEESEIEEIEKVDVGLQSLPTPASPEMIYSPMASASKGQCPIDLTFDVDASRSLSTGLQLRTDVDEGGMWELLLTSDVTRIKSEAYRNIDLVEKNSRDIGYASTGPMDVVNICKQAVLCAISSLTPPNQHPEVQGDSGGIKLNLPHNHNELEANSAFGSPVISEKKDENSSSEYVTVEESVSAASQSHDDFVNLLMKLYCELAPNACTPQDENLSTDSTRLDEVINEIDADETTRNPKSTPDVELALSAGNSDDRANGPCWRDHKRRNRARSRPRCKCSAYTPSPIDYSHILPRSLVAPRLSASWGGLNTLLDSLVPPIDRADINNPRPRYYYTGGLNDDECDCRCRSNSEADTGYGSVFHQLTSSSGEKRMPKSLSTPVPTARRQKCKIHACCCLLNESSDSSL